ncbi:Dyp-type peroxidase domain-containing protein [Streptomyces sp. NRRL F-5727]|uniref:Dyp-type peroxidase domain-containing protein n=1 Tax=Streptomyces sp. NRRL F-5727 TaxID=1463871 RepID=UPI000D13FB39
MHRPQGDPRRRGPRRVTAGASGPCRLAPTPPSTIRAIPAPPRACVAGLASDAWDRLVGGTRPRDLHPFAPLQGPRHLTPATPGDLLLHLRARRAVFVVTG